MQTDSTILRAYHNNPELRAETLAQMRAHAAADELIPGYGYWLNGKGCAVGCLTRDERGGHAQYPIRWGIPEILARLEDRLFESLRLEEAKAWPVRFLEAIPCGADLSLAWPRFALALLTDPTGGVLRHTKEGSRARASIEGVAALFQRTIDGGHVTLDGWQAARKAAYAASASASAYAASAYAASASASASAYAASAAAAAAADAAAYAAAAAAAAAAAYADAAAYAAAAAAAAGRLAAYSWQAEALLSILASCPVPV